MQAMELCIPHTVVKVKKNPPWIDNEILAAVRKTDILFQKSKQSNKPTHHVKYTKMRNQVVKMLREKKQSYFNHHLNNDTLQNVPENCPLFKL